jgi:hypothetical protein
MVHALSEARRLLAPAGTLVDLRPLSLDVPLEIISPQGSQSAGLVDLSPDIDDDIAADNTFKAAVLGGALQQVRLETFDFAYYWDTVEALKADFEEKWKGEAILRTAVLRQARRLFKANRPYSRLRLGIRMQLAAYRQEEQQP